jgi:ABC-type spermidine/putrescine transport system permease subunit I
MSSSSSSSEPTAREEPGKLHGWVLTRHDGKAQAHFQSYGGRPTSRLPPRWIVLVLPGACLFLVAYIPALVILTVLSFQTYVPGQKPLPVFTLANYARFLTDSYYLGLLLTSFYLSALGSVIAVICAYPLAYAIVRRPRLRRVILPIVALSFFVSAIVLLYGWLVILGRTGPLNSLVLLLHVSRQPIPLLYTNSAVLVGLAGYAVPYSVLVLAGSINSVDQSLEQAAQNLGATAWQALLRVTLPLTYPGVLASMVLTFALSVSAVLTPLMLGGGRVPMLATQVYDSMLNSVNYPFASYCLTGGWHPVAECCLAKDYTLDPADVSTRRIN